MHRKTSIAAVLALAISAALACAASAAGTVVETVSYDNYDRYGAQIELQFVCTGDASDGSVPSTAVQNIALVEGAYAYVLQTEPGTGDAQPTPYTVDLVDAAGQSIIDLSARSATAVEIVSAAATLGVFPVVTGPLTLTVGDLGAGDQATITITFVK